MSISCRPRSVGEYFTVTVPSLLSMIWGQAVLPDGIRTSPGEQNTKCSPSQLPCDCWWVMRDFQDADHFDYFLLFVWFQNKMSSCLRGRMNLKKKVKFYVFGQNQQAAVSHRQEVRQHWQIDRHVVCTFSWTYSIQEPHLKNPPDFWVWCVKRNLNLLLFWWRWR